MTLKKQLDLKVNSIKEALMKIVTTDASRSVIQAPPGSGKTRLLSEIAILAVKMNKRIAVATQTKSQADELCNRIISLDSGVKVIRYLSSSESRNSILNEKIIATNDIKHDSSFSIVVGTSAKWGFSQNFEPFDIFFIEEAWQLSYANYLLLADRIAPKLIMIGDPGQIPPVVTIPTNRWATNENGPHLAAPEIISRSVLEGNKFFLPATRRLPNDTAKMIQGFYDFNFDSYAEEGEKKIIPQKMTKSSSISRALGNFNNGSIIALTVKTPKDGPPQDKDLSIVSAAVNTVKELVESRSIVLENGEKSILTPNDIGIVATHRSMVNAIGLNLPNNLRNLISVDTPERWQGLERKAMIAIHPLSSTTNPSNFELETGRLCVMVSRHKSGLILLTRDHIQDTLGNIFPGADQPFSAIDINGRGHYLNEKFWNNLIDIDQVISIDEDVAA